MLAQSMGESQYADYFPRGLRDRGHCLRDRGHCLRDRGHQCASAETFGETDMRITFAVGLIGIGWWSSLALAQDSPPPVGFFNSYPAVEQGMEVEMHETSPSLVTCIAGGFSTVREQGRYDFTTLDRQIDFAVRHNLPLSIISEINPLFSSPWLVQQAREAGQLVRSGTGVTGNTPSLTSPVMRRAQQELVEQVIGHLHQHPQGSAVRYIHPGAEWWFPYAERYGEGDVEQFRNWLESRYGTIDRLNLAWDASYPSFAQVQPPRLELVGNLMDTQLIAPVSLDAGYQDCSWSTPQATDPQATAEAGVIQVTPGHTYTLTAWARGENVRGRGAYLELAWVRGQGGPPLAIDSSNNLRAGREWQPLSVTATAPRDAQRAWPLLKFAGTGTVIFDDVRLCEGESASNLAPNGDFETGVQTPAQWSFQNWTGGPNVTSSYLREGGRTGGGCVALRIQPLDPSVRGFTNEQAATYDFTLYWYETAARYVNDMSALVKQQDPSRTTVSYLTYSFAYPAEWDYTQQNAIAPDAVARAGRDIDVLGMQLCAADGDPYRATACLDVVRKYGKPMWVVDLVDFTSGVHSGLAAMDKASQAVVAHGAEGIVYCGWHLTVVPDYSFWPAFSTPGLQRMITMAQEGIQRTRGLTIDPRAALIHTMMPLSPSDDEQSGNDFRSFMGWYKILQSMQETFDVVTLRELELNPDALARYRYVIVPDCRCLPRQALATLSAYAANGGRLIAAGRFAQSDEHGREIEGTRRDLCPRTQLADFGRDYAGVLKRDRHAGNTPPLFLWRPDSPATEQARLAAQQAVRNYLQQAGILPRIELQQDAPQIHCVFWQSNTRQLVYLVNMGQQKAGSNVLQIRDCPHGTLQLRADMAVVPSQSTLVNGVRQITLPEFEHCCLVELSAPGVE